MQAIRDQLNRRRLEATLVEFSDRDAAFAALTRGAVDGFATDKLLAQFMHFKGRPWGEKAAAARPPLRVIIQVLVDFPHGCRGRTYSPFLRT